MKNFIKRTNIILVASILTSCATAPNAIEAAYVSSYAYDNYSCKQIASETTRISYRADRLMGVQNQRASSDALTMTVGLFVFWPALFFIKGKGTNEFQIARLKGEMEAIEEASIQKQCGFQFQQQQQNAKAPQGTSTATSTHNGNYTKSDEVDFDQPAIKNRKSLKSML